MRSIIALTVAAGALLTGCAASASAPQAVHTTSPSPTITTLPDPGATTNDVRVLIPLTRGVGGRGFNGGRFNGKTLYIEVACLDGTYTVAYAGGSVHSKCNGTLEKIGDAATNFHTGRLTTFTLETNGRWVFRVTEAR